jgi:gliding motility-associated-like protein
VSPNGCLNEDSVTISVFYNPPVPVIPDSLNMCRGSSISILASGGDTYSWNPNQFINTLNGPLVTVNPPTDQWYYCDVSNACGTVLDSVLILLVEANIQAGNDTIICPGESATIWASGGEYYQWYPSTSVVSVNENVAQVKPSQSTNYMIIGTDSNSCKDTAFVEVALYPNPTLQITPNVNAFYGDEVQLEAVAHTPGVYTWSPPEYLSCVNCSNPIATPNQNITYFVSFIDVNGCSSSSYVNITYDAVVYVPNTFIPDDNDVNDVFRVYGGNIKEMECLIFNRWGELIATLHSTDEYWDGTYKGEKCQDGTYTWKLTYNDFQTRRYELTGHVNLLR